MGRISKTVDATLTPDPDAVYAIQEIQSYVDTVPDSGPITLTVKSDAALAGGDSRTVGVVMPYKGYIKGASIIPLEDISFDPSDPGPLSQRTFRVSVDDNVLVEFTFTGDDAEIVDDGKLAAETVYALSPTEDVHYVCNKGSLIIIESIAVDGDSPADTGVLFAIHAVDPLDAVPSTSVLINGSPASYAGEILVYDGAGVLIGPAGKPTITKFYPGGGPIAGTQTATDLGMPNGPTGKIIGTNLGVGIAPRLTINGVAIPFEIISDSVLTFGPVPAGVKTGKFKFESSLGTVYSPLTFISGNTINPPYIGGFSPDSGPVSTVGRITGGNFGGSGRTLKLGTLPIPFQVTSDWTISFTIPNGATTGRFHFASDKGFCDSADNFVVTNDPPPPPPTDGAPSIYTITPSPLNRQVKAVVSGSNFRNITELSVMQPDNTRLQLNNSDATLIDSSTIHIFNATTDHFELGVNTLRVKNALGGDDKKFTVGPFSPQIAVKNSPPKITSIGIVFPGPTFSFVPLTAVSVAVLRTMGSVGMGGFAANEILGVRRSYKSYARPGAHLQAEDVAVPKGLTGPWPTLPTKSNEGGAIAEWISQNKSVVVSLDFAKTGSLDWATEHERSARAGCAVLYVHGAALRYQHVKNTINFFYVGGLVSLYVINQVCDIVVANVTMALHYGGTQPAQQQMFFETPVGEIVQPLGTKAVHGFMAIPVFLNNLDSTGLNWFFHVTAEGNSRNGLVTTPFKWDWIVDCTPEAKGCDPSPGKRVADIQPHNVWPVKM